MPSCTTYRLTWVSVTLGVEYLSTAVPAKCSREEIPHTQGKRNPSKTVRLARGHQRANTLKPYSQKTSQSNHTRTTALSNSMKLSHPHGATQDESFMVERSDRMWSTGEGNANHFSILSFCLFILFMGFSRQEY